MLKNFYPLTPGAAIEVASNLSFGDTVDFMSGLSLHPDSLVDSGTLIEGFTSYGDYKITPVINAPATPEKILMSLKHIEKKL